MIKTLENWRKSTRGTIEPDDAGPKIHFYLPVRPRRTKPTPDHEGHPSVPPYHESTTADHSSNASCASIPYSPTNPLCAALLERLL